MKQLKKAEEQLREKLEKEGWKIYHKGWPDFFAVKPSGDTVFIEVKAYRGDKLKKEQHFVLTRLAKLGLSCFRWTPDGGFEEITPSTPLIEVGKPKKILTSEERLTRLNPERRKEILEDEANGKVWYY